jgi:hypothetical protein
VSESSIKHLGLDTITLIKVGVVAVFYLLLIFVFIFVGIAAFTTGGSFSAVINSLFPMAAGLGMGVKKSGALEAVKSIDKEKLDEIGEQDSISFITAEFVMISLGLFLHLVSDILGAVTGEKGEASDAKGGEETS